MGFPHTLRKSPLVNCSRVFEITIELLTRHSLYLAPGTNGNVKKVDFFLVKRCLYIINTVIPGCIEIHRISFIVYSSISQSFASLTREISS